MPYCIYCGTHFPLDVHSCPVCQVPRAPSVQVRAPRHDAPTVGRIFEDIRTFQFNWVVPYETAISPRILENGSTWVMLLFGFAPLALFGLDMVHRVDTLLFILSTYFALAWSAYFYVFVARRRTSYPIGLMAMAFTTFVGIPLVLMMQRNLPFAIFYALAQSPLLPQRILGFVCGAGFNEELFKALPVLLIAYKLKKIHKPLDGIFYGALSGLGFGISEGMRYIGSSHGGAELLIQTLLRTTSLPFLHAMWASVSGYFIALALINRRRSAALILIGLMLAACYHGLYDTFAATPMGVGLAAFMYLLFMAYIDRSQTMARELEQAEADAEFVESMTPPS